MSYIKPTTAQATNLSIKKDQLAVLLESHLVAEEPWMIDRFIKIIRHFYPIPIFKNFFDLIMSNCLNGKIKFKLQDAKFFDLDEGNCLTMLDKVGYSYVITIKKLAGSVVIHELGHLVEKELQAFLDLKSFASMVYYDIANLPTIYRFLHSELDGTFIKALQGYKPQNHSSEIFARFFEFFSKAKDVGFDEKGDYFLKDIAIVFKSSLELLAKQLPPEAVKKLIDPKISSLSTSITSQPTTSGFSNKIVNKSGQGNSTSARWGVKSNGDPFK